MISVLEFGGFDVPEVLADYTADAEYERTEAMLAAIKASAPDDIVLF